jgi:hypothetical protein
MKMVFSKYPWESLVMEVDSSPFLIRMLQI